MGNRSFGFPIHNQQEVVSGRRRDLFDIALKTAAKHFTHEEFSDLERDLEAGRIDVRLYEGGLVLMRVAS